MLDLAVRSGATLSNLAAGQLHPSLPPAAAFTDIHAFQVRWLGIGWAAAAVEWLFSRC